MKEDAKYKKQSAGQIYLSRVSDLAIALSIRHIALMLKSGLSLSESVKIMSKQAEDPRLKDAYHDIHEGLQDGNTLGVSMKKHPKIFSDVIISIVSVGEEGAVLEKNLIFLADFLKKKYEFDKKLKSAMSYPMIIFGLAMVEMMGMIFFILPRMEALFSSFSNIPPFTKAILDLTKFFRTNLLEIGLVLIVVIVLFILFFRTSLGKKFKDIITINFPVLGKVNRFRFLANFSRTMGILLGSGTSFSQSLKIASDTVSNFIYTKALEDVRKSVKGGNTLATSLALHPTLFPETYTKILDISESTGTLEENLTFLSDYYTAEVTDLTENLATLLEPLLLILVAVMIGLLAITIVGPIYQLIGSIN